MRSFATGIAVVLAAATSLAPASAQIGVRSSTSAQKAGSDDITGPRLRFSPKAQPYLISLTADAGSAAVPRRTTP